MFLAPLIILLVLAALFTAIQTFYLEAMRLRARDLPSLEYFKTEIEERLGLRSDEGVLTFSLLKHTCLVVFSVLMLAHSLDGAPVTATAVLRSLAFAWLFMLVFAYLIPQLVFRRTSGEWLLPLLPFYKLAALIIRPLVRALSFLRSLLDIAGEEDVNEPATSAENIEALIDAGTEEGLIQEDDRKLIQSVVAFGDKVVREVMTARPNIVAVAASETLEDLHRLVVNVQYTRIPVYETTIDDMIGFVHSRDMFEVAEAARTTRTVREVMRPVRFVPETKPASDLMREMQQEGGHMVIVVDEYGTTAGLATMEDLVEVILGEIRDEHEPGSDVTEDGHGGFIVAGNFDIARIADVLEFQPAEDIESTTIGGLVMEWSGCVPKPGETLERDGLRVEVLASDEMRVEKVRLSKAAVAE